MLLLLEFPSEGKSLHNRTEETLKEEITGMRRRGGRKKDRQCYFILSTDLAECVGMHVCVFITS